MLSTKPNKTLGTAEVEQAIPIVRIKTFGALNETDPRNSLILYGDNITRPVDDKKKGSLRITHVISGMFTLVGKDVRRHLFPSGDAHPGCYTFKQHPLLEELGGIYFLRFARYVS